MVGTLNISVEIWRVSFCLTDFWICGGTEKSRRSAVGMVTGSGIEGSSSPMGKAAAA
jgi:hypothetical protein